MLILLCKVIVIIIASILIRGTLPRYRIDQIIVLNWKISIYLFIYLYIELILLNIIFKLI